MLMRDQNLAGTGKAVRHEPRGDGRRRLAPGMLRRARGDIAAPASLASRHRLALRLT